MTRLGKVLRAATLTLTALVGLGPTSSADIVLDWNSAALNAVRTASTPPPVVGKNLAMLHAAMHDAINGIDPDYEQYLAMGSPSASASQVAAGSTAAHDILVALYAAQSATFDALHDSILQGIPDGTSKTDGIAWGQSVAQQILAARANDGSTNNPPFPGSTDPGQWRPTISFGGIVRPALLPGWGNVTPFALDSGDQFRPPAPPALWTFRYFLEWLQVRVLGRDTSPVRSADQTEIARFWGYGPATATPPGHWNQVAQAVAGPRHLGLAENARLFALLNIALADAAIVSWDCKYVYNYWRPITAIQLADQDGNFLTWKDPDWMPLLPTPPFPEYTSGHSTFSGAAAKVLALFFRKDRIGFSVGSDDLPGVQRSYHSFSHAANESGFSRILGGIHYWSANIHGLQTGAQVGRDVFTNLLRPQHHHGR